MNLILMKHKSPHFLHPLCNLMFHDLFDFSALKTLFDTIERIVGNKVVHIVIGFNNTGNTIERPVIDRKRNETFF